MDFLQLQVIPGVTVGSLLVGAVGIVAFVIVFRILRRALRSQTPGAYQARMRCPECQWVGIVAELKPVCKKCGNTNMKPAV